MPYFVYVNGVKADPRRNFDTLDPDETGVFESMRTYAGCVFREEEHFLRLRESAQTTGCVLPKTIKEIRRDLYRSIGAYRAEKKKAGEDAETDLFIRLSAWKGEIIIMIGEKKHPGELYEKGIVLMTSPVRRSLTNAQAPQAKTGAYQGGVLACLQPAPGAYERLFLDADGFAAEVSVGNLFIISRPSGKGPPLLKTPPAYGILNGVTRKFVIECAPYSGVEAAEEPLTRHDIYNAVEAFLTNTSWEVLPVRELDRRMIGETIPGPLTRKIHRIFRERALKECRRQKSAEH